MGVNVVGFTILWTLHLTFLREVTSDGVFELKLSSFTNNNGLDKQGYCCEGIKSDGKCSDSCRTFFHVCLTHYQAQISLDTACTFGSFDTPVIGLNSFDFPDSKNSFSNPIRLPFDFSWPGTFSLIIEAWHDNTGEGPVQGSPRTLISRLKVRNSVEVGTEWTNKNFQSNSSDLEYNYRVICGSNYYGAGCSELCRPRDDNFGHYTCSQNGTKLCLNGWTGPYCDQAVCLAGCHPTHGQCEAPDECKCHMGYQGKFCDQCIPYPGCQHGTCTQPWECKCEEGWGGLFCNQDLNYCTHHQPCKNDATCTNTGQGSYSCTCKQGFTGTNCEIEIDDCQRQPCQNNGVCSDTGTAYVCKCPEGFYGKHCESTATSCAERPCKNGAGCTNLESGYKCTCQAGYTGVNCDAEIDECSSSPCLNDGRCIDEFNGYTCSCMPGFSGDRCQENHNDCTMNPCLNGGSCIDRVNDFECRCVPGFVGALCQENVDDCLNRPCANGGTCHDLVNDFTCTCAPGFGGKDCRINKDDCEPQPCLHGGTCLDQVNDYECKCLEGYFGKACEFSASNPGTPVRTSFPGSGNVGHVNTWEPQTTTEGRITVTEKRQADNPSVITMQQLLLIICLGVGIPIIIIIVIIVFLLCNRRRQQESGSVQKENTQNEITNMNNKNKCFDTTIVNSIPPSNMCLKYTNVNEEQDSNTIKNKTKKHNINLERSNKLKDYTKECCADLQVHATHSHSHIKNRDKDSPDATIPRELKAQNVSSIKTIDAQSTLPQHTNKSHSSRPQTLEVDASTLETCVEVSDYSAGDGRGQKSINTESNSNSILFVEKHRTHPNAYAEGMLATEV